MIGARWRCYDPDCPQAADTAREHHAETRHNVMCWPEEEGGT